MPIEQDPFDDIGDDEEFQVIIPESAFGGAPRPSKKPNTKRVQKAERGTYVKETLANAAVETVTVHEAEVVSVSPVENVLGEIVTYTRLSDIIELPLIIKSETIQGRDIAVFEVTRFKGDFDGDYLSCKFRPLDPADYWVLGGARFGIVNIGGTVTMPKVEEAWNLIASGKRAGPLVFRLVEKLTRAGVLFWDVE